MPIGSMLGMHVLSNDWRNPPQDADNLYPDAPAHTGKSSIELIDKAADGGSSLVRIPLDLSAVDPDNPVAWQYVIDGARSEITKAASRGLKIIFQPGQTPPELTPDGDNTSAPTLANIPELAERFKLLVKEIYEQSSGASSVVLGWEVGNEPNLSYDYTQEGIDAVATSDV